MNRDYREALDITHPMGAARLVRRDVYAWPGGYEMALVASDGEMLCHKCVGENFASISRAHRHAADDGWRPHGFAVIEEPGDAHCAHCGELFWEEERKEPVIIDRVFMVIAEFDGEVCFWRGHLHEAAVVAKHEFENEYADEIEAGAVKFLKVVEVKLSDDLEVVGHADQ